MRIVTLLSACVLAVATMSSANAQCNRGGGRGSGGTTTGAILPITMTTGVNSPLAAFNSLSASPNATLLAAQYRAQQYQNMLAQQQRNMQLMAHQQQLLARQSRLLRNGGLTSSGEQLAIRSNSVRERRRQRNAEKAFQLASRAEARGQTSKAQSQYRRVVRIVGTDSELGSRASDAIAALSDDVGRDSGKTMLVADNTR